MNNHKYATLSIGSFFMSFYMLFSIIIRNLLPYNFVIDSMKIRSVMQSNELSFGVDNSFKNAALFFRSLGFSYDTPEYFEALFSLIPYALFLYFIVFVLKVDLSNLLSFITFFIITVFFGIYYSVFSKDLIAFCFILIAFLLVNTKYFNFSLSAAILLYAAFIRSYWILFFFYFLFFKLLDKKNITFPKKVALGIVSTLFILYVYKFIDGQYISNLRAATHSVLSANTNIENIFPANNIWFDYINTLNTLINLFIPLNGLGSLNEMIYYLIFYFIIYQLYLMIKINNEHKMIVNLYISFLFVQSLFEPDMGSVLRHQMVLLFFISFFTLKIITERRRNNEYIHNHTTL